MMSDKKQKTNQETSSPDNLLTNQLANVGMRIRKSVDNGYITPTSSPNQNVELQRELYTSIEPPITPSIFRSASETLSLARQQCELGLASSSNDVFGSPLPLPPKNKANKFPMSEPPKRPYKSTAFKRPQRSQSTRFNISNTIVDEDIPATDSDSDLENENSEDFSMSGIQHHQRPIKGLKKSTLLSSSPGYQQNPISSPTNNNFSNIQLASSSPTSEPWKNINYSAFADMNPDDCTF